MNFSLILPIYNEERNIDSAVSLLLQNFPETELILVNDGSTDATASILEKYAKTAKVINYARNMGKGYAIKQGVLAATTDYIIFCDADIPFGINGIKQLVEKLEINPGLDIVITEKIKPTESFVYHLAKQIVRKIIFLLTGLKFNDTQAGLKGFKKEVAKKIFSHSFINRFAIDIEILYLAKKFQYSVGTISMPVTENYMRSSKFTMKEGWYLFKDIFKIYFHHYNV
ncbi:MAG TPA: glycosyltransferase [Candidatus Paceibacterota bacterium]|nr:glycosyltransferase [Candidatus Paceibacterota bacterium]